LYSISKFHSNIIFKRIELKNNIIKTLEEAGYEFVSLEIGRKVTYKCEHGEFNSHSQNCQKDNFRGGCNICRYKEFKIKEFDIIIN
jgi:hypothetical protein